jgi:hypothetical protein
MTMHTACGDVGVTMNAEGGVNPPTSGKWFDKITKQKVSSSAVILAALASL